MNFIICEFKFCIFMHLQIEFSAKFHAMWYSIITDKGARVNECQC